MNADNSKYSSCRFLQMTTARNVTSPVTEAKQIQIIAMLVFRSGAGEETQKPNINSKFNASLNTLNHHQGTFDQKWHVCVQSKQYASQDMNMNI